MWRYCLTSLDFQSVDSSDTQLFVKVHCTFPALNRIRGQAGRNCLDYGGLVKRWHTSWQIHILNITEQLCPRFK